MKLPFFPTKLNTASIMSGVCGFSWWYEHPTNYFHVICREIECGLKSLKSKTRIYADKSLRSLTLISQQQDLLHLYHHETWGDSTGRRNVCGTDGRSPQRGSHPHPQLQRIHLPWCRDATAPQHQLHNLMVSCKLGVSCRGALTVWIENQVANSF